MQKMSEMIAASKASDSEKLEMLNALVDGHQMMYHTMREHSNGEARIVIRYPGSRKAEYSKRFESFIDCITIFRHHVNRVNHENAPIGTLVELEFTNVNQRAILATHEVH